MPVQYSQEVRIYYPLKCLSLLLYFFINDCFKFSGSGSSPMKGVNINTSDIIQASFNCLDQEREEFEKIIEDKNKLILDKEKTVSYA